MAPVNRTIGIARMPTIAARIRHELDRETRLGSHTIVAGTNALYAYKAASGTIIQRSFVATDDADLLWDTKQSLLVTATGVRRASLMGILRRVDKTFSADYAMNAANSKGYIVDLICPQSEDFTTMKAGADIEATAMTGAEWLLASPQMEETIVGADGHSLRIVGPEPRTYAWHKHWLSQRQDRKPAKRPRDRRHATIVAKLSKTYFGVAMDVKQTPWLPKELKAHIKPLTAEARAT